MSTSHDQHTLFGENNDQTTYIKTTGRTIRPIFELTHQFVDEHKITFTDDSLRIRAVGPANVALVRINAPASAFETYDTPGDHEIGVNANRLTNHLANARKGQNTNDTLDVEFGDTTTLVEATRDYPQTTLTRTSQLLNIDTDSIREKPNIPDLELRYEAEVDPDAFTDAIDHLDRTSDHAQVWADGDTLIFGGEGSDDHPGEYGSAAKFDTTVTPLTDNAPEHVSSRFSMDYLRSFATAVDDAYIDSLRIQWGDELPLHAHFYRTDDNDETVYEGEYVLAPRIQDNGGRD